MSRKARDSRTELRRFLREVKMKDPQAVCKLEYDRLKVNGRSFIWSEEIQAIVDTVDNTVSWTLIYCQNPSSTEHNLNCRCYTKLFALLSCCSICWPHQTHLTQWPPQRCNLISPSGSQPSSAFYYLSCFPATADIIIEVIEVDEIDKGYSRYFAFVQLIHLNYLLDNTTSLLLTNRGFWFCLGRSVGNCHVGRSFTWPKKVFDQ